MKIVTVLGTRPQYIKAIPLSLALSRKSGVKEFVVDTGQHFDFEMSEIFVRELGLALPAVNLGINSQSHARMTAAMLPPIEEILSAESPDLVLVYGDTNSTLSAALAATKLNIRIAHVEGGIRTSLWNPEEINRRVVDTLSDDIFCPTRSAYAACQSEGLGEHAYYTGDVMFDTLRLARTMTQRRDDVVARHGLKPRDYVLFTIHRPENTGTADAFMRIVHYTRQEADGRPIVFPAHPRVARLISESGAAMDGFLQIKPLGYLDMARVAGEAALIVTDSGGLQKEAFFHDVPCVVANDDTPWPELRSAGRLKLWTDPVFAERKSVDDFGDGHAAEKIVEILTSSHA